MTKSRIVLSALAAAAVVGGVSVPFLARASRTDCERREGKAMCTARHILYRDLLISLNEQEKLNAQGKALGLTPYPPKYAPSRPGVAYIAFDSEAEMDAYMKPIEAKMRAESLLVARRRLRDCFGAAISTDGHGLRFDTTIDGRDVRVWRAATSTDPWLDQFDKPGVPSPRVKGRSGGMVWSWKGQPSVAQDAALRHELRSCLS